MGISQFISFVSAHRSEILEQTVEHLLLTLISLIIAIVLGLTTGIYISRYQRWASPLIGLVNAIQTIPSIALLGFLLPFLGIGVVPAIVALFLYALLPIVRNTYTGIHDIDPSVREAAIGMGMSPRQVLIQVELPLAMPVIFAGIRTAFVINVGVATLCALIAAGGLGEFIFRGLSTNNPQMILAGAIPAALMALFFDWVMGRIEKNIYRILKPALMGSVVLLLAVLSYSWWPQPVERLKAGFPSEFIGREDGYPGLRESYGLDLEVNEMEIGLMYDAVKNGDVDVISGFSTDGRIKAFDLISLADDKHYFPPYYVAPLVRQEILDKDPYIEEALTLLAGIISDEEMAELNYRVDQGKEEIRAVARSFLASKGLNTGIDREGVDVVIGSKNFTENFILAYMFEILIENYTDKAVELKLGFGGTKLLFDALNAGEVDIYPEYTGTGLLVILRDKANKTVVYNKDSVYHYVKDQFDRQFSIKWLSPLGFNNTHALLMRRKQAQELQLHSISDLATK